MMAIKLSLRATNSLVGAKRSEFRIELDRKSGHISGIVVWAESVAAIRAGGRRGEIAPPQGGEPFIGGRIRPVVTEILQ